MQASSGPSRRRAGTSGGRRSSGARAGRAHRPRLAGGAASPAVLRRRTCVLRARPGAGRTSSASRCAPGRPARSGTPTPARRAGVARLPSRATRAHRLLVVEPLRVVVRRGAVVESTHRVHAVAVRGGRVVESAGDPELVCFFRSSAKPFQALPLARAYADLDSRELAIAAASPQAVPEQRDAVRQLLARAGASEEDLECGPEPTKLEHNCSGKHAGMLALCRARGWPSAGYPLARPPGPGGC